MVQDSSRRIEVAHDAFELGIMLVVEVSGYLPDTSNLPAAAGCHFFNHLKSKVANQGGTSCIDVCLAPWGRCRTRAVQCSVTAASRLESKCSIAPASWLEGKPLDELLSLRQAEALH